MGIGGLALQGFAKTSSLLRVQYVLEILIVFQVFVSGTKKMQRGDASINAKQKVTNSNNDNLAVQAIDY